MRQAACVWLLAVVSKCSRYHDVQTRIMDLQDAFILLLSESDGMSDQNVSESVTVFHTG